MHKKRSFVGFCDTCIYWGAWKVHARMGWQNVHAGEAFGCVSYIVCAEGACTRVATSGLVANVY